MGDFLAAAYKVLDQCGRPMSASDIVSRALDKGLLTTKGKTPAQTMKSKLATDILWNRERSLFMRAAAGRFALREFRSQVAEHLAPRFKRALFDEEIIVFPADHLKNYVKHVGLNRNGADTRRLLNECFPMRRRVAEEDRSVIQLVSVYIVSFRGKYLTFKRTKRLPEARLHGFYSLGFGGHLNPDDIPSLFNFADPNQALMFILRELEEELLLPQKPRIIFRGLIYDTSREVSKQHLGLVYNVTMTTNQYRIGERGFLMDPRFESINQILGRAEKFENWSVLIAKGIRDGQL
jgi:predicted NUDIX family phosphoesterase